MQETTEDYFTIHKQDNDLLNTNIFHFISEQGKAEVININIEDYTSSKQFESTYKFEADKYAGDLLGMVEYCTDVPFIAQADSMLMIESLEINEEYKAQGYGTKLLNEILEFVSLSENTIVGLCSQSLDGRDSETLMHNFYLNIITDFCHQENLDYNVYIEENYLFVHFE